MKEKYVKNEELIENIPNVGPNVVPNVVPNVGPNVVPSVELSIDKEIQYIKNQLQLVIENQNKILSFLKN